MIMAHRWGDKQTKVTINGYIRTDLIVQISQIYVTLSRRWLISYPNLYMLRQFIKIIIFIPTARLLHFTVSQRLDIHVQLNSIIWPGLTLPLSAPMLSNHQRCLVAFIWGKCHKKYSRYVIVIQAWPWKMILYDYTPISQCSIGYLIIGNINQ